MASYQFTNASHPHKASHIILVAVQATLFCELLFEFQNGSLVFANCLLSIAFDSVFLICNTGSVGSISSALPNLLIQIRILQRFAQTMALLVFLLTCTKASLVQHIIVHGSLPS